MLGGAGEQAIAEVQRAVEVEDVPAEAAGSGGGGTRGESRRVMPALPGSGSSEQVVDRRVLPAAGEEPQVRDREPVAHQGQRAEGPADRDRWRRQVGEARASVAAHPRCAARR